MTHQDQVEESLKPWVIAKEFTDYVINNIDKYRLRGRCVIKVSSWNVKQFMINKYNLDPNRSKALRGLLGPVFHFIDYYMRMRGFVLIERVKFSMKTKRYYAIPNCSDGNGASEH
jgi:hypothetical protein